jgi:hypothetical protein
MQILVGVKFLRQWPFLGRVRVCFVEPPYFQMTVKPIFGHGLDVAELPGISGWLVCPTLFIDVSVIMIFISILLSLACCLCRINSWMLHLDRHWSRLVSSSLFQFAQNSGFQYNF